jgi:single-strand DNA-binding protein
MFQQIILICRLGRDPEMRFTPTGQAVATFPVATDRQYNDAAGQVVKETTWFRVQVWGKMAEACNTYLAKGKLVMVQGRLVCDPKTGGPRTWQGKDDFMHTSFEVTASQVKFLSSKSDQAVEKSDEGAEKSDAGEGEQDPTEGIPF